ncbi:accessory Sec system glycosylation chaperone GtfB [Streptococcus catagoni]|uniref:accessory Sec system glycosylation chaperone GtfB n=1 Tax=Streptococcus catagoni TaxID=2654874 RepID=UPI0014078A31|nr:accessory Sec system glycosylation chaperone GtfB [Streptococcus catagoni]
MLNIFDNYDQLTQDLHYSLVMSAYKHPTVILNETGFLPDSLTTPYAYFTGDDVISDKPAKFFNQVKVPRYWEIKSSNHNGEIFDQERKKANIFYAEPTHKRLIRAVEWLDKDAKVRLVEFYNKHGRLYAQSVYNKNQEEVLKTYYDQSGREKIVENFVTGDIILNHKNQIFIFKNKLDFIFYFLEEKDYNLDTIIYNSLALPFQISHNLKKPGKDILVWQEHFHGAIPGNMQIIINGQTARSQKIIIPDPKDYQDFLILNGGHANPQVQQLGYLYPIKDRKTANNKALILTNSDQIEGIEELTSHLSEFDFHIAALTEMSPKLQELGQRDNVLLYPNVNQKTLRELWQQNSLYLDINHGNEILDGTRRAFEACMPILTFDNTCHNAKYILRENCFSDNQVDQMIRIIKKIKDQTVFDQMVDKQLKAANHISEEDYREVIGHV